jgi:ATP-dependent DNA ligase
MLAKLSSQLPDERGWLFEPKWDGFRALIWKSGDDLLIQSRELKPLGRYFPELEIALRACLPERCVLDGEVVIASKGRLDFGALQLRIHPAASRVKLLAEQSPSSYIAWDLLALGDEDFRPLTQEERRTRLVDALSTVKPPIYITPATRDRHVAADWFGRFEGAGLDGVIAKPLELPYLPNKRVMLKVKHQRTADCAVAGFRWYKGGHGTLVGSLLLALYDDNRLLRPVGVCASFKRTERAALSERLKPLRQGAREVHPWRQWAEWEEANPSQRAKVTSRWNPEKTLSWEPIHLCLVAEVSYDHMQGHRFRHATHFLRWRPDKSPDECRYEQLEVTPPSEIAALFGV